MSWEIVYPWPPNLPLTAAWSDGHGSVCAVGSFGTVVRLDAHGWRRDVLEEMPKLLAVAGEGPQDLFAVGFPSSLYHFDGRSWELHTEGVKSRALSAHSGTLVEAGFGGVIWLWEDAWSTVSMPRATTGSCSTMLDRTGRPSTWARRRISSM